MRAVRRLGLLLAVELGALGALVAVRDVVLPDALPHASVDDVALLALWAGALAVATWLLVSTLAWCTIELAPAAPERARRAVGLVTLPAVRVLVTRAVVLSLIGSIATTVAAAGDDATRSDVRTGRDPAVEQTSTNAAPPDSAEHRVVPGDNLWSIAEMHLLAQNEVIGDPEIARYWLRVIEHNRARLRSGDPDLIYPGEVVTLPPV